LLSKEKASVFVPGDHGGTFGGNPLACAVGVAVMNYLLDNDIVGNAQKTGVYLMAKLNELKSKYSFITDVRGKGLLLAVEFNNEIGQKILDACVENGLLVNRVKPNAIRLMPPLIIGNKEVDEAIGVLDTVFSKIGQ
jgi:acetylornithine/N-succinyldiaminopimelate aminotransferase